MRPTAWLFIAAIALTSPDAARAQQPTPLATIVRQHVKDPDEASAFMAAFDIADPARKAAALEAFVARYPKSAMNLDALVLAMTMYVQARNDAKVADVANRVLEIEPGNVQALSALVIQERPITAQGRTDLARLRAHAERGLQSLSAWTKPDDMDDATFRRLHDHLGATFNGAAGFVALQAKDYAKAAGYYRVAVRLNPSFLTDMHQLALAELDSTPTDATGFWHLARMITQVQSNPAAAKNLTDYGRARYRRYHGSEDGWNDILARAATQTEPPPGFAGSITPGPPLAELAVRTVRDNGPASLSFSDWALVLSQRDASSANKAAADSVWSVIQAKQQGGGARLRVRVISATRDTVVGAVILENQMDHRADLRASMKLPMAVPPAAGTLIMIDGLISDYVPSPFMFVMEYGEIISR